MNSIYLKVNSVWIGSRSFVAEAKKHQGLLRDDCQAIKAIFPSHPDLHDWFNLSVRRSSKIKRSGMPSSRWSSIRTSPPGSVTAHVESVILPLSMSSLSKNPHGKETPQKVYLALSSAWSTYFTAKTRLPRLRQRSACRSKQ